MSCEACPFAFTDHSEQVQNYGCLPTPADILRMKAVDNINWECHARAGRLCAGFAVECAERSIDVHTGKLGSYVRWYHEGVA